MSPRTTSRCKRCSGPTMRVTCASASTCFPAARRWLPRKRSRQASEHADPEVRVRALVQLAADGDAQAAAEARALADRPRPLRRTCRPACGGGRARLAPDRRAGESMLVALLDDADPTVRAAALDAVVPEDAGEQEVVRRVVAALEEPADRGQRDRRRPAARRLSRPSPRSRARLRRSAEAAASGACGCQCGGGVRVGASSSPRFATLIAWSCSRRSTRWMRQTAPASFRRTSSTTCSTTQPHTHLALSLCAPRSPRPMALCGERWRTRATSRDGSSSPCWRFATAIGARRGSSRGRRRGTASRTRRGGARRAHLARGGRDRSAARSP